MSPYHSMQIRCVFLCSAQDGKADLPNLRPTEHAIWLHRRGARGWNPSWQLPVGRAMFSADSWQTKQYKL